MKAVAILAIRVYQELFSPRRAFGSGTWSCIYYPSCSHYAIDAIRSVGFWRGAVYAILRIARCRPGQGPRVDYFSGSVPHNAE